MDLRIHVSLIARGREKQSSSSFILSFLVGYFVSVQCISCCHRYLSFKTATDCEILPRSKFSARLLLGSFQTLHFFQLVPLHARLLPSLLLSAFLDARVLLLLVSFHSTLLKMDQKLIAAPASDLFICSLPFFAVPRRAFDLVLN